MQNLIQAAVQWLRALWSPSGSAELRTYRRHVRAILVGWAITAGAMALLGLYPNKAGLDMYRVLLTDGLPWQQHWLAALEIAGPLTMLWHLLQLQRWNGRAVSR